MKKHVFISLPYFILMHIGFLIYSFYTMIGKLASKEVFFSFRFIFLYALVFVIMFVYALLWQQVLKKIQLSLAMANKTITIIWGLVFGKLIFNEEISFHMIIGTVLILTGIFLLSIENKKEEN